MADVMQLERNSSKSNSSTTTTWPIQPFDLLEWNSPLDYIDRNILVVKKCPSQTQAVKDHPQHQKKTSNTDQNLHVRQSKPVRQQSQIVYKKQSTSESKIFLNACYTIDRIQNQVRSITFRYLHERRLTLKQAELYYAKNILSNMRKVFIQTLNQMKENHLLPNNLQQSQQEMVEKFDKYLSLAIEASSQHYSRFLRTPLTLKMQEAIQPVSRRTNAKADIISMHDIHLARYIQYRKEEIINTASSYSEFVTKVIEASYTTVSTKNVNNQNFAGKFAKFTEILYASSQHSQYQKMIQQIANNLYNAERQTLNLFLQIFEDREWIKEMPVKEKGRGLEYMVSKIKFESLEKYQRAKRSSKCQKEIVCQPLPSEWSQSKKLEIMQEWINQLELIFDKPSKHIFKQTTFKNVENNDVSLCKEAKLKLIKNIERQTSSMKKEVDQLRKKFQQVQGQLLIMTPNEPSQSLIGGMSALSQQSMIDLMNNYLCILIHHLIIAGNHIETRLGKQHVNLVSFIPTVTLSSKIQCNQTTFITILNTLTMLDQNDSLHKFKLLEVSHFSRHSNSLYVKYLLGETVKCSLELCFIDNGFKTTHYNQFISFLKKISGFKFGALASCAMLVSQNQQIYMYKSGPDTAERQQSKKQAINQDKKPSPNVQIKNSTIYMCTNCQRLVVRVSKQHLNEGQSQCNGCLMRGNSKIGEDYIAQKLKIESYCVNQMNEDLILQNCHVIGLKCKTLQITPYKACFDEVQHENEINVIDEQLLNLINRKASIQRINSRVLSLQELKSPSSIYFQIKGQSLAKILRNIYPLINKENISYFQTKFREYQKKRQFKRLIEEHVDIMDFNQNRQNYSNLLEYLEETKKDERINNVKATLKTLHLPTIYLQKLDTAITMLSNLQKIDLRDNRLKSLDMSSFKNLTHLNANHNELVSVQFKTNRQLAIVQLNLNQLRVLSLRNNYNLTHLDLSHNQFKEVSLTANPILKRLNLSHNHIINIDLSKCPQLRHLDLSYNNLTAIKLEENWNIVYLNLSYNDIGAVDLKKLTNLTTLIMSNAQLQKLDVSSNIRLTKLMLGYNKLGHLDVKSNINLIQLNLDSNKLETINLQQNSQLSCLSMQSNCLKRLDLSHNYNLQRLDLRINRLIQINLDRNVKLRQIFLNRNKLMAIDLCNNTKLNEIHLASNSLTQLDISKAKELQVLDLKNNQLDTITFTYYYKATPDHFTFLRKGRSCNVVIISHFDQQSQCRKFIQHLQDKYHQINFKHDFYAK